MNLLGRLAQTSVLGKRYTISTTSFSARKFLRFLAFIGLILKTKL